MDKTIDVIINGFKETLAENTTISQLIVEYKEGDDNLIVEHNGRFVYPRKYEEIILLNDDRIEFINPNFGG
jgi:thiamine biosynthesis protein ThiS